MNDSAWLGRIRAEQRQALGLEGLPPMSEAVIDVQPLSGMGDHSMFHGARELGGAVLQSGGLLLGAGAALGLCALLVRHPPRVRRNMGLAAAALLFLGLRANNP